MDTMKRALTTLTAKFLLSPEDCYVAKLKRCASPKISGRIDGAVIRMAASPGPRSLGIALNALAGTTHEHLVVLWAIKTGNTEWLNIVQNSAFIAWNGHGFIKSAIWFKQLGVLRWMHTHDLIDNDSNYFVAVAGTGDLRALRWYRGRYGIGATPGTAFYLAAKNGHLHVMKWVERNLLLPIKEMPDAYAWAAKGGHFAILRWLRTKSVPLGYDTFRVAVQHRCSLKALKSLHAINPLMVLDKEATTAAAGRGMVSVLKWLVKELGAPIEKAACVMAAGRGYANTLDWLKVNGCACGGVHDTKAIERLQEEYWDGMPELELPELE
ncbi:MAG: hypothetical protein KGL39_10920 [Patescibacteria group bacterium]|nr:hypothetical protein [Patescibacteria group bacterium]